MMAGTLCLNVVYVSFLFYFIKPENLLLKIPVCWLVIGETYTLIYHVVNKIYLLNISSETGKNITLVFFAICCLFFLYRAIKRPRTEKFDPRKTFVIKYLPKNTAGIFNYIFDHSGHKAFYQDGKIYKFEKDSGFVVSKLATYEDFKRDDMSIKEIPIIKNIDQFIGKKFNLFFYNCNHLIRDAQRT